MEPSKAFSLNLGDLRRVGINGLLVGLAAGLTYIGGNLSSLDLGASSMVVVPIVSILLDAAVKWAKNNHVVDQPDTPA
ncbi:MAG: hypothetical protein FI729_03065 [SAR202 cluster bacterium]|jgi:hypothetical protein|nr:hypothetical protein [SAR202 cluster bacterium]|tara:strand:+ start:3786 stop:4019 length:234 start_codon:yes stop_codon:yes gene_type:complete